MQRLGREFYGRYTPKVARELLGTVLVRVLDGERLSGVIVETEAYRGDDDPASHAYRGRTKRNELMFGPAGHAYVYFSYGSHWCFNVTTEAPGRPGAVLLRAVEPLQGFETMLKRRGEAGSRHLADGPGRLTRAFGIELDLNGEDLTSSERLFIETGSEPLSVASSGRVGVSRGQGLEWRFFVPGNRFVSKTRPPRSQNP